MPTEAIQGGPAGNGGKKPGPKGIKKNKRNRAPMCDVCRLRHPTANCPYAWVATMLQRMQAAGMTPADYVPGAPSVIPAGLFSASSAAGASVAAAGPVAPEDPDASEAEDAPAQEAYVERSLESRITRPDGTQADSSI